MFPSKAEKMLLLSHAYSEAPFHERSQCPADTAGKKIDTKGQTCPSCFTCFSQDIPDHGKAEDHLNKQCSHQKHVKRVLLYGVENASDPGVLPRGVLVSALSNPMQ